MTTAKKCPKCGKALTKIVYGLPTNETTKKWEEGEVMLGGCCINPFDPAYRCRYCKYDFDEDLEVIGRANPLDGILDNGKPEKSPNEVLEIALEIAVNAHRGQTDKSGMAYILHPLAVAAQLDTLELKTIAILHDTIEDTDVTADYLLEKGIPQDIVDVVQLLSKPKDEDYESYLKRVLKNPLATKVKLADLAHNTSPERASGLNEARRRKYERARDILEHSRDI